MLGSVASTLRAASALCDAVRWRSEDAEGALTLEEGRALLEQRTDALFGPKPADRGVRIMVTMPDGAAETPDFIEGCLGRGMDAMRINTASGEPETWLAMIDHLRRAERRLGKKCHVLVDLAGPKVRVTRIHRRGEERDRVRLRVGDRVRLALDPGGAAGHVPRDRLRRAARTARGDQRGAGRLVRRWKDRRGGSKEPIVQVSICS